MSKKEIETFYPINRKEWRLWLKNNHSSSTSVWVIFYKKNTLLPTISWSEAVDEALCFGWIDSTKKTIDSEKYIQYFSKRKTNSIWSKLNKDKVEYLTSKNLFEKLAIKLLKQQRKMVLGLY
ncbi:YdeI/OmpD-associated family protein [Zobellia nedashkovskayae]